MIDLFIILIPILYFVYGAFYSRTQYAIIRHASSQLDRCARGCKSYNWHGMQYKTEFCNCGYLNPSRNGLPIRLMLGWPVYKLQAFLTSGEVKKPNYKHIEEMEAKLLDGAGR